jgi:DNA mismatch repair protein MutS
VQTDTLTPIRRQYLAVKQQVPGAILFFRLGDFYETFDEDARLVSRELEIVLTGREMGKGNRVPLAGIPYHAADGYIARLIAKGYKVAICEQMEDPALAKGIVDRQVVRVVTPGTLVEPGLLSERRNNYLAALVVDGGAAALAHADISTGEFAVTHLDGPGAAQTIQQELSRLAPSELLVSEGQPDADPTPRRLSPADPWHVSPLPAWQFGLDAARRALHDHFGVSTLDGYGLAGADAAVRAAGALLQYVGQTQKAALAGFTELKAYSLGAFMVLDAATRRNLEIFESTRTRAAKGSLLGVLDATKTAMGARLLRKWVGQPLLELPPLVARQDGIEAFYQDTPLRTAVVTLLARMGDLERLANRVGQRIATPRDLVGLRASLELVPRLRQELEQAAGSTLAPLTGLAAGLDPCLDVVQLISGAIGEDPPPSLAEGGVIRAGFSAELDGLHSASRNAKQWIANLERTERERTGIKNLKVGYNRVFGYYLEITSANVPQAPADYIRKQTLVGAERYITPDLKEYESLILNAQERLVELETAIFRQVLDQVGAATGRLAATAAALAELDVFSALAETALRHRYVRPALNEGDELHIVGGRHPVVELALADEPFVPNDLQMSNREQQLIILTGPNMAGKSTFLRQVALIVLMAQVGSFVPAESASIGLVDRIFTRVGAQDDIATGQSTFMVEMVESANILHNATARSLIILDEIGRGTSTYDGLAIARAVVEYIHNHPRLGGKTLFATHYHELTELAKVLPRVRNFNVAVAEEGDHVVFLRRIVPGGADRSYGIHVAQLAGLPRGVIRRAEQILEGLEKDEKGRGRKERLRQEMANSQMAMFAPAPAEPRESAVLRDLAALDVNAFSPLDALTKLYELQKRAAGERPTQPPRAPVPAGDGGRPPLFPPASGEGRGREMGEV